MVSGQLGQSFAEHLRKRSSVAALALAADLAGTGDLMRSRMLHRFAEHGEGLVPADWWATGATCWLGLEPPTAWAGNTLWFDPLEVACALFTPLDNSPSEAGLASWMSVEPAAAWQIRGAHDVSPDVPGLPADMTGEGAVRYGSLFGKALMHSIDWNDALRAHGDAVVRRMWGSPRAHFGGGGAMSGDIESVRWAVGAHDPFVVEDVPEDEPLGFSFTTRVGLQGGLWRTPEALDRA